MVVRVPPETAVDVCFRTPDDIVIRVSGLNEGGLRAVTAHLSADIVAADSSRRPPPPEVVVGPSSRETDFEGQGGDVVATPHGVIVVQPDRPVMTAYTGTPADRSEFPTDLLAAGMTIALTRLGIAFLHGTAFRLGGASPIAVGASGSGKSTLAAAALGSGARVVSDDSLLASLRGPEVTVSAFRNHLSFRSPPDALLPPELRPALRHIKDANRNTWRLALADLCESSLARSAKPDRLWVVSVDRRLKRSRITPLDRAEGLSALIPASSPLVLSPRYRQERAAAMAVLTRLVETCPPHRVRLGRDLLDDPRSTLETLLNS